MSNSVIGKFAVVIPTTEQIGMDTWRDSVKVLVLDTNLTFDQIVEEARKVSKGVKVEVLQFTNLLLPESIQ
jgi:hypothetical protein